MKRLYQARSYWLLCFIFAFLLSSTRLQAQETLSDELIEQISASVVSITVERSIGQDEIGSGVVISPTGVILTTLSLVNHADIERIVISTYVAVDRRPEPAYLADVIYIPTGIPASELGNINPDEVMNLAVLRVQQTLEGDIVNRSELELEYVVYWTENLENADRVYIFAYTEALANGNITADGGILATNLGDELEFRTDTLFGTGASGGLIINEFGEMVGIASSVVSDENNAASLTRFLPLQYICAEEPDVCDLLAVGPPPVRTTTRAVVCIGINDILNLRSEPSRSGEVVEELTFGQHVAVLGQSVPNDGFTWLELQSAVGNQGWAAEIINNTRTLIPYTSEVADEAFYPIEIGKRAIVCVPPRNISVNLRETPAGIIQKQLIMGAVVTVTSGPVEQDGTRWWNVMDVVNDAGWVAEVDDGVAILIGLPD